MTELMDWSDAQWTAFKFWLEDLLRAETVELAITKVDGSKRVIQATRKTSIVNDAITKRKEQEAAVEHAPDQQKKITRSKPTQKPKADLLLVWDTEAEDWRTIRVRHIDNILVLILKYDYKHEELPF